MMIDKMIKILVLWIQFIRNYVHVRSASLLVLVSSSFSEHSIGREISEQRERQKR